MSYCINPWCKARDNNDRAERCQACGSPLLINNRFILLRPLFDLKRHHICDVFEALDTKGSWIHPANTLMILKVLKGYDEQNKYIAMLEKEAEALQLLKHPGIPKCDLDDFFSVRLENGPDELFCLAMSKFEGITLDEWIQQHGRVGQSLALNWLVQLVEILDVVHKGVSPRAGGFIHRDIKPSNIIVQPDNTLALIDFGGARQTTHTYYAKVAGRNRELVTQIHSLSYTAPEQIDGKAIPQSDFFSLGKTFIHAVTGKAFSEIPRDKITGKLLWHPYAKHLDKPLRAFLDQLSSDAIARRPKDTTEILSYLREILPFQLKRSRFFKSKLFLFGTFFALILSLVLGFRYGRLFLAEQFYRIGLEQMKDNQLQLGKKSFEQSIFLLPTEKANTNLAFLCKQLQDFTCVYSSFKNAIELSPTTYPPYFNLASFHEDRGEIAQAIAAYRKSITVSNNKAPEPINNLARLLILEGKYAEAHQLLKLGLGSNLNQNSFAHAVLLKNLGWVQFILRNYDLAKLSLVQSINLEPNLASSHCLLAQVLEIKQQSANDEWRACLFIQSDDILNPEVDKWRSIPIDRLLPPKRSP